MSLRGKKSAKRVEREKRRKEKGKKGKKVGGWKKDNIINKKVGSTFTVWLNSNGSIKLGQTLKNR